MSPAIAAEYPRQSQAAAGLIGRTNLQRSVLSFDGVAIATGAAEILPQSSGLELHLADLSLVVGVEASSRED